MVKSSFSTSWTASVQPRKQRKFRYNAPLHLKQNFLHVHLSADLRKKYGLRNIQIRKGDKISIIRGQLKKQTGKVDSVNLKRERVFIQGIESVKKDGSKIPRPLHPSNLIITELDLTDKKRKAKLESKPKAEFKTETKADTKTKQETK
jgi:large subunit ribosomal protein L24